MLQGAPLGSGRLRGGTEGLGEGQARPDGARRESSGARRGSGGARPVVVGGSDRGRRARAGSAGLRVGSGALERRRIRPDLDLSLGGWHCQDPRL